MSGVGNICKKMGKLRNQAILEVIFLRGIGKYTVHTRVKKNKNNNYTYLCIGRYSNREIRACTLCVLLWYTVLKHATHREK